MDDQYVDHLGCALATVIEAEFGTVDLHLRVDTKPSGAEVGDDRRELEPQCTFTYGEASRNL